MFCGQEFQITCLLEVLVIFVVVFCTWIFVSEIWLSVPSVVVVVVVSKGSLRLTAFKEGEFTCREFFFQFHIMVECDGEDGEDVFADFCVDK